MGPTSARLDAGASSSSNAAVRHDDLLLTHPGANSTMHRIRKPFRPTKRISKLICCGSDSSEVSHERLSPRARPLERASWWGPQTRVSSTASPVANAGRSLSLIINNPNIPSRQAWHLYQVRNNSLICTPPRVSDSHGIPKAMLPFHRLQLYLRPSRKHGYHTTFLKSWARQLHQVSLG
jgi:hypothetical protein